MTTYLHFHTLYVLNVAVKPFRKKKSDCVLTYTITDSHNHSLVIYSKEFGMSRNKVIIAAWLFSLAEMPSDTYHPWLGNGSDERIGDRTKDLVSHSSVAPSSKNAWVIANLSANVLHFLIARSDHLCCTCHFKSAFGIISVPCPRTRYFLPLIGWSCCSWERWTIGLQTTCRRSRIGDCPCGSTKQDLRMLCSLWWFIWYIPQWWHNNWLCCCLFERQMEGQSLGIASPHPQYLPICHCQDGFHCLLLSIFPTLLLQESFHFMERR